MVAQFLWMSYLIGGSLDPEEKKKDIFEKSLLTILGNNSISKATEKQNNIFPSSKVSTFASIIGILIKAAHPNE